MLSRVANSMFWMSRYVERAENVARFLDVNQTLSLTFQNQQGGQWAPVVYTSGDEELFAEHYQNEFTAQNVLRFLMFDLDNPNSIASCLNSARENARTIRENLSTALWEEINKFYHQMRTASRTPEQLLQPNQILQKIKRTCQVFVGVMDGTMSHDEGWHFAQLARLLERSDKTSRILDVKYFVLLPDKEAVGTPLDILQWAALLESTSALQMYRRKNGRIEPTKVVEFLTLDRMFPRAIQFCMRESEESLREITGTSPGMFQNRSEQLLGRLRSEFNYMSVQEIIARGLHEFIDDFQSRINEIGQAINQDFFQTRANHPATEENKPLASQSQSQSQNSP